MRNNLSFLVFILITFSVSGQNKSLKRGICGDASGKDLSAFAPFISWYYNWSIQPPAVSNGELSGIEWVPMQWGGIKVDQVTTIASRIPSGSKFLLGFNEPNFKSQSNLTPAQAAAMWPYVEEIATKKNLILVSPAVNWCGDCVAGVTSDPVDWLDKFIAACPDCRFDYIAVHNYNSYLAPLKSYVQKFKKYGKPLWLTEFASWDDPVDSAGVVRYMKEALPYLEKEPLIYRYSWFATRVNSNHNLDLLGTDGTLTELGRLYATLPLDGTATGVAGNDNMPVRRARFTEIHPNDVTLKKYDHQLILAFSELSKPNKVSIFDCQGKIQYTGMVHQHQSNLVINTRDFKPGMYIIKSCTYSIRTTILNAYVK